MVARPELVTWVKGKKYSRDNVSKFLKRRNLEEKKVKRLGG